VVASFATFGLFWGSWAVMLFNIQHTFSLNDAQLGLLLAVAIAVAGASSAVMAHFCDRVGARRLLWIALCSSGSWHSPMTRGLSAWCSSW
jgi:sugar phosphate permease